eukprot:CAMPEP_0117857060 /NCGR_PEP_ID=MMETSP0950-20121206/1647_1 /TAXON_ID=44440 /ORGANISM="Chattonella subsalsa, Strain CCMP2191" /LENGTH=597 /DNA_ID=CAMNT_0005706339 /DNA_START=16 /DNA_END=1806 /DNA_ORIENTATION=+
MQNKQQSMLNRGGPLRTVDIQPPFEGARVFLVAEDNPKNKGSLTTPAAPGGPPQPQLLASQLNTPLGPTRPARTDPLSQAPPPGPSSDPLSHLLADPTPTETPLLAEPPPLPPPVPTLAANATASSPFPPPPVNVTGAGGVVGGIPVPIAPNMPLPQQSNPPSARSSLIFQSGSLFPISPRSPNRKAMAQPAPRVIAKEKKLDDYVEEFLAGSSAILPSLDQLDNSPKALRKLGKLRAWKKVVEVASFLLHKAKTDTAHSFTHQEEMEVKLTRMWGLFRLKQLPELQSEFQSLGLHPPSQEKPLSPQQPPPPPPQPPSSTECEQSVSVPFAMRLLAAEVLPTSEDGNKRADAMNQLLFDLTQHQEVLENAGNSQSPSSLTTYLGTGPWAIRSLQEACAWKRRVRLSLANLFVKERCYRLALGILEDILQEISSPSPISKESSAECSSLTELHRCRIEVYSRIGKIFLQMGNIRDAKFFFNKAEEEDAKRANTESGDSSKCSQILLNNGLLALAQNEFGTAMQDFDSVIKLERIRQSEQEFSFDVIQSIDSLGLEPDEHLLVAAVNNYAVCALYTCNLKGAIKQIEDIIREDPVRNMW